MFKTFFIKSLILNELAEVKCHNLPMGYCQKVQRDLYYLYKLYIYIYEVGLLILHFPYEYAQELAISQWQLNSLMHIKKYDMQIHAYMELYLGLSILIAI